MRRLLGGLLFSVLVAAIAAIAGQSVGRASVVCGLSVSTSQGFPYDSAVYSLYIAPGNEYSQVDVTFDDGARGGDYFVIDTAQTVHEYRSDLAHGSTYTATLYAVNEDDNSTCSASSTYTTP